VRCKNKNLNSANLPRCSAGLKARRKQPPAGATGNLVEDLKRHPNFKDITGRRFGRLKVISFSHIERRGGEQSSLYICRCDCGRAVRVRAASLNFGSTKSCGCLQRDITIARNRSLASPLKRAEPRTHMRWIGMKNRCLDSCSRNVSSYKNRGIKICRRWRHSFDDFFADMGRCPIGMTLERKNNNLGYNPSNCIWATAKVQANNRRNNHFLEFNGERMTISQWSEKLGIPAYAINNRIKYGWSVARILTEPVNGNYNPDNCVWILMNKQQANRRDCQKITHGGKTQCIAEWSRETGIHRATIKSRLAVGMIASDVLFTGKHKLGRKSVMKKD
jgi:hypothetical protein